LASMLLSEGSLGTAHSYIPLKGYPLVFAFISVLFKGSLFFCENI
jgi:hypothetical protein